MSAKKNKKKSKEQENRPLTKKEIEYFKQKLIKTRKEVFEELSYFKDEFFGKSARDFSGETSTYRQHIADLSSDSLERETAFYLSDAETRLLSRIDKALERIENNTYGICLNCGKYIQKARLEAVPHARFCINCKNEMEKEKT